EAEGQDLEGTQVQRDPVREIGAGEVEGAFVLWHLCVQWVDLPHPPDGDAQVQAGASLGAVALVQAEDQVAAAVMGGQQRVHVHARIIDRSELHPSCSGGCTKRQVQGVRCV